MGRDEEIDILFGKTEEFIKNFATSTKTAEKKLC
jgi:hypothetical protein